VAAGIHEVRADRPHLAILLVTHYQRILEHLVPDVVHVLVDGRVVATGGPELAATVEARGFDAFRTSQVGA
jgi:Fe-S cluster assembly ATP-binding protein